MREGSGSRTAERVAVRRAAHQLLDMPRVLDDPLALSILASEERDELLADPRKYNRNPIGRALRAFLAVRSRFAEDALASAMARGVTQYVILGAGFDTSAYRPPCSSTPSLRAFEVDHPDTQAVKRRRLAAAEIGVPPNLTFIAADLSQVPLRDALRDGGLDLGAPAFVSWLGVIPYLTLDAITATLTVLGALPQGTEIVFDYGIPPSELNLVARMIYKQFADRVAAAGEPWITYFKPGDLRALLLRCGFTRIDDFDDGSLTSRFLANRGDGLRLGPSGHIAHARVE
jgi:methyltransferase (TIGR00027 family)